MSVYQRRILPWLIDRGMRNRVMTQYRGRTPPRARGRVLEVGVGAGLNLPYYGDAVQHLFGVEPAAPLREAASGVADAMRFPVSLLDCGAEALPLEPASIDTVVSTWTLCSIPDVGTALLEMRRVLRPDGRLLFFEHGRAPDAEVARLQDRLAPVLRGLAGCNPNRPIDRLVEAAGFEFEHIERAYFDGPRFIAFHYVGVARLR